LYFKPFESTVELKFELLQEENAEFQRQWAEVKGKITLQERELIRTAHRFTGKVVK